MGLRAELRVPTPPPDLLWQAQRSSHFSHSFGWTGERRGLTLAIQSLLHPQLQPLLWGQLGLREKGRDRRGCPEFVQPTSAKSLGLGGQLEPRGRQGWDLACLGSPSPE